MTSTRAQLRIVAFFYAAVGILVLGWFVVMRTAFTSAPSGSTLYEYAHHAAATFLWVVVSAICYLALSGLSLRFPALSPSWRIVTIAASLLVSLSQIARSVRDTLIVTPIYLHLGPSTYGDLAVELGVFWGRALPFSLCSYLLWKRLRDSNDRLA